MKNNDPEPIDAVINSLFIDEIGDLTVDLTDNVVDVIVESEVLQHIPGVRVIKSFLRVTVGIRERHFLSKTLLFIKNVNQGNVDKKAIEKK